MGEGLQRAFAAAKATRGGLDFAKIFEDAHQAARDAVANEIATNGPEDPHAFDCGFAWVKVSGKSPFVRWIKKQLAEKFCAKYVGGNLRNLDGTWAPSKPRESLRYGSPGYPTGWQFWKPGEFPGQSIRIHEAGSRAFAKHLTDNGIDAYMDSRLD